jgi:hypothetical protein
MVELENKMLRQQRRKLGRPFVLKIIFKVLRSGNEYRSETAAIQCYNVPFRIPCLGIGEWAHEATTSSVNVDRDVDTGLGLILVKNFGDFNWFVMASVGAAPTGSC